MKNGWDIMNNLKIVFMGTPDFSVNVLEGLIKNYDVSLVISQPDKEIGRKRILTPPPVKVKAIEYDIEVFQPENIKIEYKRIIDEKPDLIVTCAYGQIVPKEILECPKYGCINVHASLLPQYRGGAPIHKSIIDGNKKTGVTIMYMVEKMDAGDIISQVETNINDDDTLETLHDRLSILGTELLLETIPKIISGNINPIKQDQEKVTYAWNIKREDEKINFNKNSREIFNLVRGLNPTPSAYTTLDGKVYKIYKVFERENNTKMIPGVITKIDKDGIAVKTNDGEVVITEIKPDGKGKMNIKDFINGINKEEWLGKKFE